MIEKGCNVCVHTTDCSRMVYDGLLYGDCYEGNMFEPSELYTAYLAERERADKAVAKLTHYTNPGLKCNKGHENNLPLSLWDCPLCTEEIRAKVERFRQALDCETCQSTGKIDTRKGGVPLVMDIDCPDCTDIRKEAQQGQTYQPKQNRLTGAKCGAERGNKEVAMEIQRVWAMPNKWTFTILPIKDLLTEEVKGGIWVDPFAGENSPASITNDLNPERPTTHHMDALEFLMTLETGVADGVLYDPPYSLRQASECYKSFGKELFTATVTSMKYWSDCKDQIRRITKYGGKVICFGWNSGGIGKNRGFEMNRVLLVPHGGSKNDTIVTVETKIAETLF